MLFVARALKQLQDTKQRHKSLQNIKANIQVVEKLFIKIGISSTMSHSITLSFRPKIANNKLSKLNRRRRWQKSAVQKWCKARIGRTGS